MEEKDRLEYYNQLTYQCVLKKKGNLFILLVPELQLVVEGESLEKAYEKMEKEKELYFKEMIRTDYTEYIQEPAKTKMNKTGTSPLLLFAAKFFTATLGILLIVILLGNLAVVTITPRIEDKVKAEVSRSKKKVKELLVRFHEMPEEEKEELRQDIRSAVKDLKPFIDELKVAFEDNTEPDKK